MEDLIAEKRRLQENEHHSIPLERWGSYLSERAWGTVREDYSPGGNAWQYFPHDHARSRTYVWGEDGIAGICDYFQNICFAPAFWNGKDSILKERLFGLANGEGNHGEDVKELYYCLDNVPTHYYMRYLYKYPQVAFPYDELRALNKAATLHDPEVEILDTGVFDDSKYFDVYVEYAKLNSDDIFIKISIKNHGSEAAAFVLLPQIWFYNRWQNNVLSTKPSIVPLKGNVVELQHERMEPFYFYFQQTQEELYTENETNTYKLFGKPSESKYMKDAFHEYIVDQSFPNLINNKQGTKFSPVYRMDIAPGDTKTICLRLSNKLVEAPFDDLFEKLFELRKKEANEFYGFVLRNKNNRYRNIEQQALAGLLWSKQYYHYDVEWWLTKPDGISPLSLERQVGRNHSWQYLKNQDIIAMPDKWEYPWYAAWDLAFHTISLALVDVAFAKNQLVLLMREWYMNQDGQLPAYEWDLNGVNPPVHAFAALEVYKIDKKLNGRSDINFLKKIFQKLIINFTWWVNRKDANGNSIFEGGFLGLDNIGIFNRNEQLGEGISLEQTDGTSWMGMYALNMMEIAYEIATHDISFEDSVTKFYEHFVIIAEALNSLDLWNKEDEFFYDVLNINKKEKVPLKVRSIVGVIPLFAVSIFANSDLNKLPDFIKRMTWFENYRTRNNKYLPNEETKDKKHLLLSLVNKERLQMILQRVLDEGEFLSEFGVRSLSKFYEKNPYSVTINGEIYSIAYEAAESTSMMFGGNSNWRGPIWMPINYLVLKAIDRFGDFYENDLLVEFPTNSGNKVNLKTVAKEIANRLLNIFLEDDKGGRPVFGKYNWFYQQPENKELLLFYEYFNGDNGMGLGASHQTGWTALILNLISQFTDSDEAQ